MLLKKSASALLLASAGLFAATAAQAASPNIALGKAVTATSYYASGSETFEAANVVDGRTLDGSVTNSYPWPYWLSAQGTGAGESVTINLGQVYDLSGLNLFDSHNREYYDRGTQDFHISLSTDGTNFTTVATDTFTEAEWRNQTGKGISLANTAQYVRFNVDTLWGGQSAGLAEMQVFGTTPAVPEPDSIALVLAGVCVAGFILRRRS
jgi:hypothetical protein